MNYKILLCLACLFILGCGPSNKLSSTAPIPKDWIMEPIPNGLDKVGDIFSVSNRQYTHIYTLNVSTASATAVLPQESRDRTTSAGILLNFLNITALDSSSLNLGDTTHMVSHFDVGDAAYSRAGNDLPDSFMRNKDAIIRNLNFYDPNAANKSHTYIIAEILRSPQVNITLDKTSNANISGKGVVAKILGLNHAGISVKHNDSTTLVYTLKDSLVIFYKLKLISKDLIINKGGQPPAVNDVTLGKDFVRDSL